MVLYTFNNCKASVLDCKDPFSDKADQDSRQANDDLVLQSKLM